MAQNVSVRENAARFRDYPYDMRRDSWTPFQQHKLALIAARVCVGETVLDVGCNGGYLVEFLPPTCTMHGVDLSPHLVAAARTRLASAQVAGADDLPFIDKSMDVVVLADVIEYVFDPMTVLRELARVARRAVVGSCAHECGTWGTHRVDGHAYMVRSYDASALHALLSTVGTVQWLDTLADSQGTPQHYLFEVGV